MFEKITIDTVENYKWGDNCDGWHFLKTDELSVIREKMNPGTAEQMHLHQSAQQLFYILSGEASFEIAGELLGLKEGESVHIPAGTIHKIANKSNDALHFLVISQPPSHGARINVG
ncbi:MAG: cupin domain-containing protein [Ferruginibacter sp.]